MLRKILSVVGDARQFVSFDVVESIGERHVAVRVMVSVRLAVSSDVDQLRRIAFGIKSASHPACQILAAGQ